MNSTNGDIPVEFVAREDAPTVQPVPIDDLRRRLELLTKHGVRTYRDGVLSIDLDANAVRKRGAAKDDDNLPAEAPEL